MVYSKKFSCQLYKKLFQHLIVMIIGLVSMYGSFVILRWAGLSLACDFKTITFVELAVHGVVGIMMYFMTTAFFRLPQRIFKMSLHQMMNRVLPKGKKS